MSKTTNTAPFTVTPAPDIAPDAFRVTGRRVSGIVTARVDVTFDEQTARGNRTGSNDDDPEVIEVTVNLYRDIDKPAGDKLTINGIPLSGYRSVRINGWNAPRINGGYIRRDDVQFGADATPAASAIVCDIAMAVAGMYGTAERANDARIENARRAEARATEARDKALAEFWEAVRVRVAAEAAEVAPIIVRRSR